MKKVFLLLAITLSSTILPPARADFGDADFPKGISDDGPKSHHDAWCGKVKNKCRVHFHGRSMWVEGQGGIQLDQLIRHRFDKDGENSVFNTYYNHISYKSKDGQPREALFLFAHSQAQQKFLRAFIRWKRQESLPTSDYLDKTKPPRSPFPQI